jgi:hypothetical protein
MAPIADGRALPPKDGDVWRFTVPPRDGESKDKQREADRLMIDCGEALDPSVGWTWNRHGHYDSHIPEVFPYVTFSERRVDEMG